MTAQKLSAPAVRDFLFGQTLYAFDPTTLICAATVLYRPDGICRALFSDGTSDHGEFGFEGEMYWTKYASFRGGDVHRFYLTFVDPDTAQAYRADGKRAYLQSTRARLSVNKE